MNKSKTFNRTPLCFIVSSPSGAGKTTMVTNALQKLDAIEKTISHTTRSPRPNEKDGIDYHFTDKEKFKSEVQSGGFIEWAEVYQHLYGTSKKTIQQILDKNFDAVLVIENQGAKEVKKHFDHVVSILIVPPSWEELKKRITNRGGSTEQEVRKRLEQAKKELHDLSWFDYVIVNDDLENATRDLVSIITASRLGLKVQAHRLRLLDGKNLG